MSALSIVITIVIVVLILILLRYLFYDPYTLQSLQSGQISTTINATSLATNGSSVPASNFAYSIWFYVNDWNYRYGEKKVIFGRMGSNSTNKSGSVPGLNGTDPCPVVALGDTENNINVYLTCFPGLNNSPSKASPASGSSVVHTCSVNNIPIQKWVNLVATVYGRTMDLYIDGKLVRTCLLPGVAKINNNSNVYVTPSGGFAGWTSKFQYYPKSLNPQEVWNIYRNGYSSLNLLNGYHVQFSLVQNGQQKSSVTI